MIAMTQIAGRFLLIQAVWAMVFGLLLPLTLALTGSEPLSLKGLVHWIAKALVLAAFPAGITVAAASLQNRNWLQNVAAFFMGACASALLVLVLLGLVAPLLGDRSPAQLAEAMRAPSASWEVRNDAAWDLYVMVFEPIKALLFALIGVQVGAWTRCAIPAMLRRPLYWAAGLGLVVSGYAVFDTTYESIVIRTSGDVGFAACYTLLIPLGICAGFALPTLALLRGTHEFTPK